MKRIVFTLATVCVASLMFAGLAVATKTSTVEGQLGGTAMTESSHQMTEHSLNTNQISELQKLLNDKGYNVGEPDGMMGPSTTAAIQKFQLDNKLTSTGTPDAETLRLLSPDPKKQEFFGLAPEYGEHKEMKTPESEEMMEETPKKMGY